MKTLVTGGTGLVGSSIESEYKPSIDELNLMDYESIVDYINDNDIDSIIHCAAKVGGIKANSDLLGEFYYDNIVMNTRLLEKLTSKKLFPSCQLVSFQMMQHIHSPQIKFTEVNHTSQTMLMRMLKECWKFKVERTEISMVVILLRLYLVIFTVQKIIII